MHGSFNVLTIVQYATQLYPDAQPAEEPEGEESDVDIESEIKKEVEGIRKPTVEPLFRNIKLSGTCCKRHGNVIQRFNTLNVASGFLQDSFACRACLVRPQDMSGHCRWRRAPALPLCQEANATVSHWKGRRQWPERGCYRGARPALSRA